MPAVNFTDAFLRSVVPPAEGRIDLQDARRPGLVLRVSASGAMSWSLRYRDRTTGKVERLTLGRFPAVSLAKAREITDQRLGGIASGESPRAAQRKARAEHASGITFDELAERFLNEYVAAKRPKSFAGYSQSLAAPRRAWGTWKARSISRDDVLDFAEKRGREAPIAANRSIAVLSKLFNWTLDLRDAPVSSSPIQRIPKPGVEKARDRVLRDDEIKVLWDAFGTMTPEVGRVMKTLLLTGQRLSEVVGMERDELVDLGKPEARWLLPGTRTKNKRAHIVPLSQAVVELILASINAGGDEPVHVFVSRRNPGEMMDRQSFARATKRLISELGETVETRAAVRRLKADPPTPHDLRRTLATGLGGLRVRREVIKSVLNHIEGDVTAIYARHEHDLEKREALDAWAGHVLAVVEPPPASAASDHADNVVVIRRGLRS